MEGASRISDEIRGSIGEIIALWWESRGGALVGRDHPLVEGTERLTVVFTEFLRSPETVETFSRGGSTHTLMGEIAGHQHDVGRDAVGVIEDFAALRRSIWRVVEGKLDLVALEGGEVAGFFVKLMQASDWATETALEAFDAIVREEMDEALGRAAATDLLTGLPDRDLFSNLLLPRALEIYDRLSVVVFDIARFSETVASGEVARAREDMQRLTDAVQDALPEGSVCARFGDDEICAFLPGERAEDAYRAAERVLRDIAEGPGNFQVDVGVAEYPAHGRDAGELVSEMLGALRMAKRVGGSGIVIAH